MTSGKGSWLAMSLVAAIATVTQPAQPLAVSTEQKTATEAKAKEKTVIAKVNGQAIYEDQLTPQVKADLRKFKKFGARKPSAELMKRLREKALDRLIAVELLYQASQDLQIPDIDQKIEKKMEEMRHRHASGLKNMSEQEIRESVRRQIYVHEYLLKNGLSEPEIPEAEIREFYEENKQGFASRGYVHARHILRTVAPDATPEEKEEARRKIEEARRLILEGKPFAEVAKEYSQCNSAQTGGDLGPREKGYMPPEFDAVAFSIDIGKTSDVIETKFGYHIIQVLERTPEGTISSYDQVRDFIARFLQKEASQKKTSEHVRHLRESAKIEAFSE
ncbi:MAG: peptidylprolyl isomerase [Candidatus Eiseniibacteriota bacterium]|nr:MAG: peptidylprolyl isomerase [Candidatus Eisenbacteria bacterium]